MNSEGSICLIKDFPFATPTRLNGWLDMHVRGQDINWEPQTEFTGELSVLPEFIQDLRNANHGLMFLSASFAGDEMDFEVCLYREHVQRLCSILPNPSFTILCRITIPPNGEEMKMKKCFGLKSILADSDPSGWRHLFSASSAMNRNCSFDIILEWAEHPKISEDEQNCHKTLNATTILQNLFGKDSSKDLVIVAGNGVELRCHRIIFEAHSDVLAAMLSPDNGMKESETGRIEMTENSEEGLTHLIRYLYGMELNIEEFPCDVVVELFKTAHKYKLTKLEEWLVEMLFKKGSGWFTPDDLLEIYFHVKNLDEFQRLHEYLLSIMLSLIQDFMCRRLSQEVRSCERFKELKRSDADAACALIWRLFDLKCEDADVNRI